MEDKKNTIYILKILEKFLKGREFLLFRQSIEGLNKLADAN